MFVARDGREFVGRERDLQKLYVYILFYIKPSINGVGSFRKTALCFRMGTVINFHQVGCVDCCIGLGRGQTGMTQKLLDRAQIATGR